MLATESIEVKEESVVTENIEDTKRKNKIFVILIVALILIALMGLFSTVFALFNITNVKIIQGVSIRGIDVSGLTQDEAKQKVTDILNSELEKDITLKHQEFTTTINPKEIDFRYNIDEAINYAYQIARDENIIENNYKILDTLINKEDVKMTYRYNNVIENAIFQDIESKLPDIVQQYAYYLESDNLVITPGKQGVVIDKEKLDPLVIESIINNNEKAIEIPVQEAMPNPIDIDKIHSEVYVEPQNAYYTQNPFVVYPHVTGVDFNVEELKQILMGEQQESYSIKLIYTIPEITQNQIGVEAFPDLISTFTTRYNASDRDRTTNLRLASEKINGVVLMPGEEFSYNKTVGERTIAAGYKDAKIYLNGQVIDGLGGGICQISSTLYNAALYADLSIIERRNHQFTTSYLKAGLDATVAYGSTDFRFKNSRQYPIKIVSEVSGGIAKIDIYGVKEDIEYDIKIVPVVVQSNANGIKTITYKKKYLNGEEVENKVISRDTYKHH